MQTKWWLIVQKQEMTRLWVDDKMVPVTLVKVCKQEIVRYKTQEKDGYTAMVVGVDKKESNKEKGQTISYKYMCEFHVDPSLESTYTSGSTLKIDMLWESESVRVTGTSKWKGFQWVMRRYNFGWGPASHGSKFHRAWGSTGNRKPRRTIRGWKMAWHMGSDRVTLRSVPVVDIWEHEWEEYLALKWSLPGAYNGYLELSVSA